MSDLYERERDEGKLFDLIFLVNYDEYRNSNLKKFLLIFHQMVFFTLFMHHRRYSVISLSLSDNLNVCINLLTKLADPQSTDFDLRKIRKRK